MAERRWEWVPVAVWELYRMVRRKDFVISVALIPALAIGSVLAVGWFRERDQKRVRKVAIARVAPAPGARAAAPVLPPLAGFAWVPLAGAESGPEALHRAVRQGRYAAALVLPEDFARGDTVRLIVKTGSPGWARRVSEHLQAEARRRRAATRGLEEADLAALDAPVAVREQSANPLVRTTRGDRLTAAFLMVLLLTAIFVTNSYLAVGISGEKQARVTEVIVSAIRPQSWMDGKIVAYTVLGLLQAVVWAASLLAVVVLFGRTPPPAVSAAPILLATLFTVVGFVFYTALFALILATIKDLQSTSKFQAYFIFLPILPVLFWESLVGDPGSATAIVLSLIPFFSPMIMPARIALGAVAAWEVWASLAVLAYSAHLMRLAAGHAFRIGMLMYGKELSLPELVRWAKEA